MLRLSLALCFVFTSLSWAAEAPPPFPPAAQPQPPSLTGDQKAQILKIQRDLAIVDLDEKRAIEQIREESEKRRTELQGEFQKLVQPLLKPGWSLDRNLDYIAATPPPKE